MDRMPAIHDTDHLLGVAVDDRRLAGVAQDDAEVVVDVALVLGLLRALRDGHVDLVGLLHGLQPHLRRDRSGQLHELGHQGRLCGGELAGAAPAGHPCIGAFEDGLLQLRELLLEHLLCRDVRPGGPLAKCPVASRAAIEVDVLRLLVLLIAQLGGRPAMGAPSNVDNRIAEPAERTHRSRRDPFASTSRLREFSNRCVDPLHLSAPPRLVRRVHEQQAPLSAPLRLPTNPWYQDVSQGFSLLLNAADRCVGG